MNIANDTDNIIERIKSVIGSISLEDKVNIHEPDFSDSNAKEYLNSCIENLSC